MDLEQCTTYRKYALANALGLSVDDASIATTIQRYGRELVDLTETAPNPTTLNNQQKAEIRRYAWATALGIDPSEPHILDVNAAYNRHCAELMTGGGCPVYGLDTTAQRPTARELALCDIDYLWSREIVGNSTRSAQEKPAQATLEPFASGFSPFDNAELDAAGFDDDDPIDRFMSSRGKGLETAEGYLGNVAKIDKIAELTETFAAAIKEVIES